jgi:hypothetical protein
VDFASSPVSRGFESHDLLSFSSCDQRFRIGYRGGRALGPSVVVVWGLLSRTCLVSWLAGSPATVWARSGTQRAKLSPPSSPNSEWTRRLRYETS